MKTLLSVVAGLLCGWAASGAELRLGIIGCDTSHVVAFTETLNNPAAKGHVAGAKVVAAYKGGSADIPSSISKVDGYSKTLQEKYGVKMYDSIEELCQNVDAVLLESVDGRPHLEQVKPVLQARKPVFIDKPMAASLPDVIEIFRLAKAANVPIFSSSSLRFARNTQAVHNGSIGKVSYAETYGPCELEPHHPDLFWYGVHGVESLYTVMGTGCQTVQRQTTPDGKIEVVGIWSDGWRGICGEDKSFPQGTGAAALIAKARARNGVFREDKSFHGLAKGEKGEAPVGSFDSYPPLVVAFMKFFETGVAPVQPEETIEIIAFMEAADESKKQGGKPVKIMVAPVPKAAKIQGNR